MNTESCVGRSLVISEMLCYLHAEGCRLKTNAQSESCELSFIWGKISTIVRETAFQIALRNCPEEVGDGQCHTGL